MSLLISLQSESIKLKRTIALYLCPIAAFFIPLVLFLENVSINGNRPRHQPWVKHFTEARELFNIAWLPLFVILITTLLLQIEYRDKTWKQVLTSPQKLINVFLAKFISLHAVILIFIFWYILFLILAALGTEAMHPFLFDGIDVMQILSVNAQSYFLIFAMSAMQFWLALRFKNFIASIAIGFVLWFLAPMMIFELQWAFVEQYPYAFSILSVHPGYKANVVTYQWTSAGIGVAILALAFLEFRIRKVKT